MTEKDKFAHHIRVDSHLIAVRDLKDGKWGSYYLSELTPEQVQSWIDRWWGTGFIPIRVKEVL